MRNAGGTLGTTDLQNARRVVGAQGSLLWTPELAGPEGGSGLIVIARFRPLAAVIGGHIFEVEQSRSERDEFTTGSTVTPSGVTASGGASVTGRRLQPVSTTGDGLTITGGSRQEPTRIIGHPDLASGASVQRGDALYVSVAEAIYRESRGEDVEIHLIPTEEDGQALSDLRLRARQRWENDRLPDGWTRPLPPRPMVTPSPKEKAVTGGLPDELRELAERIRARERDEEREE